MSITEDYQEQLSLHSAFLKFMKELTGFAFESNLLVYAGAIYDTSTYHVSKTLTSYLSIFSKLKLCQKPVAFVQKANNLPLPKWCTDDVIKYSEELFALSLNSWSWTQKLKRLNSGALLRKILKNMNLNNDTTNPNKMYLYSGHDVTLSALTRAQNITTFKIPPPGSAIIIEKYKDTQNVDYTKVN